MTTIDVIAMALEAGFKEHNGMIYVTTINDDCAKELKALVELVRADERNSWPAEMEAMERQVNILTDALAQERDKWMERTAILIRGEREACAKVCDDWAKTSYLSEAKSCARIIRERSNK